MNKEKRINTLENVLVVFVFATILFFTCFIATVIVLTQEIKTLEQESECNYLQDDRIYYNSLPTGWTSTFVGLELSQEQINDFCEELE